MGVLIIEDAERFSDDSDRASFLEMSMVHEAMDQMFSKREKRPAEFDGEHCVDCDQSIPEARLKTGAWRDIFCQERFEKLNKEYSRG